MKIINLSDDEFLIGIGNFTNIQIVYASTSDFSFWKYSNGVLTKFNDIIFDSESTKDMVTHNIYDNSILLEHYNNYVSIDEALDDKYFFEIKEIFLYYYMN